LSSVAPRRKPEPVGLEHDERDAPAPEEASVFATTQTRPAICPLDERLRAVEDEVAAVADSARAHACRSEPAAGSDIAISRRRARRAIGGNHRRFWSSVPCVST
jgi:hypothetical protein